MRFVEIHRDSISQSLLNLYRISCPDVRRQSGHHRRLQQEATQQKRRRVIHGRLSRASGLTRSMLLWRMFGPGAMAGLEII